MRSIPFALCTILSAACAVEPEGDVFTKEQARAAGKADGFDWCERFGWYGDGECDDFCSKPASGSSNRRSAIVRCDAGLVRSGCDGCPLHLLLVGSAWEEEAAPLPSPLRIDQVVEIARSRRPDIAAARARARAAAQRPAIASALEDPMIMPSIDHFPFRAHGVDASLMIEQRFPLSRIRGHRGRAAEAEAGRMRAEADRVGLDAELDAASTFLMLRERQAMVAILEEQRTLAAQVVRAAAARYVPGTGVQSDALRAEIEVARLEGALRSTQAEARAAEAMLNTSLGRRADAAVPVLDGVAVVTEPDAISSAREVAFRRRPELTAGRLEIDRALAEVSVMKAMRAPMAFVRTGPA